MEILSLIFGEGRDLTSWQMGLRALVIFISTLILVRIAGRRSFGMNAPVDNIVAILLGTIMARVIVGEAPYIATMVSGLVLALLHRALTLSAVYFHKFGNLIKGKKLTLYRHGAFIESDMQHGLVSEEDIREEVRLKTHADSLDHVSEIFMERNGAMSILLKKDPLSAK